jgi:hypothetical protein
MKTNKELTLKEFHIANNIKRAMVHIDDDTQYAKTFLVAAIKEIHRA